MTESRDPAAGGEPASSEPASGEQASRERAPAPGGAVAAHAAPAPGYERAWNERRLENRGLRLIALGVVTLLILWLARGIIVPFIIAGIIAYAFDPLVSAVVERTRLHRILVIAIGYVVTLVMLGVVLYLVAGRVATEVRELSGSGPDVIAAALQRFFGDQISIAGQTVSAAEVARSLHEALTTSVHPIDAFHLVVQGVDLGGQVVLTLFVAFYMLVDANRFGGYALRFVDRDMQARATEISRRIHVVLGHWLRGQLFLIGLVSVVLYVILGPILHIPYALTLAIGSGILEVIPYVGPVLAAATAVVVAFSSHGADTAVTVLIVYFVVRQIEDQVIMPLVIGRAVHLHPVVTIFAVLVGLSTFGVLGGLLGVPVAAALNVTLHELYPEASEAAASEVGASPQASAQEAGEAGPQAGPGPAAAATEDS